MSFVKLSIFGTSFEVALLSAVLAQLISFRSPPATSTCSQSAWVSSLSILSDLCQSHAVGPGAFGLVWYVGGTAQRASFLIFLKLSQGPADGSLCGYQEDHETLQHPGARKENISRIEVVEAYPARKRTSLYFRYPPSLTPPLRSSA